jgi:hypothetical protein
MFKDDGKAGLFGTLPSSLNMKARGVGDIDNE